jgi:hypothetical protein
MNFCPRCGMPLNKPPVPPSNPPYGPGPSYPPYQYQPYPQPGIGGRDLVMGVGAYGALALLLVMVVNVAILIWGIGQVYPHMDHTIGLFIITPYIVEFARLSGPLFFLYYVVLAAVITASFLWMLAKSVEPLGQELMIRQPKKGHSPIYTIGTVFMAVMAFNIIFYLLIESSGANPTSPTTGAELWALLYNYAEASVWEEIVSRVLLIGVPLLLISLLLRPRNPETNPRKWYQYLLGGGFTIGRKEAIFLVFSAIMFGTAHVFSWDIFKILPSAVAGLALGYLFLKVGLYASILLHFAFDYLSIPLDLAPDSVSLTVLLGLLIIVWIVIGIPYLVLYASKGLGWLTGRRIWPDVPRAAPQPSYAYRPMYQYQQVPPTAPSQPMPAGGAPTTWAPAPPPRPRNPAAFGFVCRNCGNTEATYKDGELVCTKCGAKN